MDTGRAEGQGGLGIPSLPSLRCAAASLASEHCFEASTRLMSGVGSDQSAFKCEHLRDALLLDGAAFSAHRRLELNRRTLTERIQLKRR